MLLDLHIGFVIFSFVVILLADKEAMAWMRGKKETLDSARLHRLHALTWAGLLALVVTGVLLLLPMLGYLLGQPLFVMKLLFVGILVVNAVLIGRLMSLATTRAFATLTRAEFVPLFASGAISIVSWVAATVLGIYLFS